MLNGRLYRAASVPLLAALAIAAFSLGQRPLPLTSTLAPDAFSGARATADLRALGAAFPDRRPGGPGDAALARYVARALEGLGNPAGGGFSVHTHFSDRQTIDGERTLASVVAERPGSTSEPAIVILAHRDAAARGSWAELSGTAALLELARVFAARETRRSIVLVSTSGGSGGDGGASALPDYVHGPIDAAIALGDLTSARGRRPYVIAYSDGFGSAPLQLQRTVADALRHETGADPGTPSLAGQLAHLAFPLTVGEQGVLNAAGVPAVLVQATGEHGPAPRQAIAPERLEAFGRGVLSAVDALDRAPDLAGAPDTGLLLSRKTLPPWALRLLVAGLLLAPLVVAVDGLARARRRRRPIGRFALWTLACGLPFLACALFCHLLGLLGIVPALPVAAPPRALPFDGGATAAVLAVLLTFALAWLLWRSLIARLDWEARPDPEVAGLALLLVLGAVAVVAWLANPYLALLAVPALHLWLLLASPQLRLRRAGSFALVAAGLLPLLLLVAFYADQLGLGAGGTAWTAVLLLAGGHVGLGAAILWSAALGCAAAAAMVALTPAPPPARPSTEEGRPITIRGPMTYAGPGSLGGTESALRG